MPATIHKKTLCGLRILTKREAAAEGLFTITTDISSTTEPKILASIAKDRDPARTVWIATLPNRYQLAVPRSEIGGTD